jgi:hypothetical protein
MDADCGGSGGDRDRAQGWLNSDPDREEHRPGDLGRHAGDREGLDDALPG